MGKIEFFMSNLPFKPRKNIFARCAILLLASLLHTSVLASPTNALALVRTIALPDVKGQFDHVAVDENNHRLFVAALGNNTLEVADVAEGKQLKSVVELHRPTGIIYLPEQNRVAVANSDEGMLAFYDGKSLNFDGSVTGLLDTAFSVASIFVKDLAGGFIPLPGLPSSIKIRVGPLAPSSTTFDFDGTAGHYVYTSTIGV